MYLVSKPEIYKLKFVRAIQGKIILQNKRLSIPRSRKLIFLIVAAGLLLRISYIVYGYHTQGNHFFLFGDSFSYTDSIINFIEKGVYSFDLSNPVAPFGRLPGYPVFWGLHYLLVKQYTYLAVAITQAFLDSLSVVLIYQILLRVINVRAALTGAIIYAAYIFSIVWVPITGSESLGIFISVLYLNCASRQQYGSKSWFVAMGLLSAVALYVREFLGIFFLFTLVYFIYLFIQQKIDFNRVILYVFSFALLYGLWPLRNYVVYHRVELLKPRNAGYPKFGKDFASFREWMYAWHIDVQPYLDRIRAGNDPLFPPGIFKNEKQHQEVNLLVKKCMQCGTSFNAWNDKKLKVPNCDNEISQQFDQLRSEFIKRKPFVYYVKIPALNISKALFKNNLTNSPSIPGILVKILFAWRTVLVILGFAGLFFMPESFVRYLILCFSVFMYLYITCYIRQIEMRYLLQADVWLLVPAVTLISWISSKAAKHLQNQE